jgi:hypothetical protein
LSFAGASGLSEIVLAGKLVSPPLALADQQLLPFGHRDELVRPFRAGLGQA